MDCLLQLHVQWQIFQAYSERQQVQQYLKTKQKWRSDGTTSATTFDWQWKSMDSWKRENKLAFDSRNNAATVLFEIYKRGLGLKRRGSVALAKHLPYMIQCQTFRILTRKPTTLVQGIPYPLQTGQFCETSPVYIYGLRKMCKTTPQN